MNNIKNTITFIGNAIVDILWQTSDKFLKDLNIQKGSMQLISEEMVEKLLVKIDNPSVISGGSAANTAVGFSSFGGNAHFIGEIGDDKYGDLFSQNINESGVLFEKRKTFSKEKTSKSIILVTPDAERSMNTFLGASVNFNVNSINQSLILKSKYIYIEGYLFDQVEAKKAIYDCCKLARSNNCKIALSLSDQFCVDRHRQDFKDLIKQYVDIIFANESEIKSLYQNDLEGSLSEVLKNVETGAITLGSQGSIVFKEDNWFSVDPIKVTKLVDTTGAGDLYASGFLHGFANNKSIKECGEIGSEAAAEIITHYGARPKISLKKILK
jgi:sugar/nucleoside kinase (ribokinase family)